MDTRNRDFLIHRLDRFAISSAKKNINLNSDYLSKMIDDIHGLDYSVQYVLQLDEEGLLRITKYSEVGLKNAHIEKIHYLIYDRLSKGKPVDEDSVDRCIALLELSSDDKGGDYIFIIHEGGIFEIVFTEGAIDNMLS